MGEMLTQLVENYPEFTVGGYMLLVFTAMITAVNPRNVLVGAIAFGWVVNQATDWRVQAPGGDAILSEGGVLVGEYAFAAVFLAGIVIYCSYWGAEWVTQWGASVLERRGFGQWRRRVDNRLARQAQIKERVFNLPGLRHYLDCIESLGRPVANRTFGSQFDGQAPVGDGNQVAAELAQQWGSANGLRVVPSPGAYARERRRRDFRDVVHAIMGKEGRSNITMQDFERIANAFNCAIMVHLEDCFDANDPEQRSALHEIVVAFLEGQRVTQELGLCGVRGRIAFRYQEYLGSQEAQPSSKFLDEAVQRLHEISYADWSLVNWMALRERLIGLFREEYSRVPSERPLEEMVEAYSFDNWHADEGRRVVEAHPPVSSTGT